jgi:GTPase SAR1 family protein
LTKSHAFLLLPSFPQGKKVPDSIFELCEQVREVSEMGALEELLKEIWQDPVFLETGTAMTSCDVERTMEWDTARMALNKLNHLFSHKFCLTHDQFIKIRMPTKNITTIVGKHNHEDFVLVDVGGQNHFQQEWEAALESQNSKKNVAIIFVASLVDYQHNESNSGNRLEKCLQVWDRLLKNKKAFDMPIVLLLNKQDIFNGGLKASPLSACPLLTKHSPQKKNETLGAYQKRSLNAIKKLFYKRYKENPHGEFFQYGEMEHVHCTDAMDAMMVEKMISSVIQDFNKHDMREMFATTDGTFMDSAKRVATFRKQGQVEHPPL